MTKDRDYIAAYRHRTIRQFKVGPFKFENHILKIRSEAEHEAFKKAYDGLLQYDKIRIVEVLQLENERPVNTQRTIRDAVSTDKVKDSKDTSISAEAVSNESPVVPEPKEEQVPESESDPQNQAENAGVKLLLNKKQPQ